jgi:hypothetical protein
LDRAANIEHEARPKPKRPTGGHFRVLTQDCGRLMRAFRRHRHLAILATMAALLVALPVAGARAEDILSARYDAPVDRYGHFAPGRPHEYARLAARTSLGRTLLFELPPAEVFEDITPRLVRLTAGGAAELLVIISHRDSGSRLALLSLNDGRIGISAQSPPIGTPMRWLNPVGVADLDGDGRAEIAAVITPHIGGTLKLYSLRGRALVETAALGGFSNHQYGSAELGMSGVFQVAGKTRLLVPDTTRSQLRIIGFESGRLAEVGRCALPAPLTGALSAVSVPAGEIGVVLASGTQRITPANCLP